MFNIRPFNLDSVKPMRDLDPKDIDRLVSVRGMVSRISQVIPDMKARRDRHGA